MKLFEPRLAGEDKPRREQHLPTRVGIDAYGNGGFRFGGMSHRGSILCLPSGVHGWSAVTPADIDAVSLELALAEADQFEVMIIGSGLDLVPLKKDLREAFRERGARVDVMSTGAAIRTYNIMFGENRSVAAAFLVVA